MKKFLGWLERDRRLASQVAHVEEIPPRPADMRSLNLEPRLIHALHAQGVRQLYSHQAKGLELARASRDLAVATPTASGKTLVYVLPVLEGLLERPKGKSLFLFPLKALEQDQLQSLNSLALSAALPPPAAIYDGDTPASLHRRLRESL